MTTLAIMKNRIASELRRDDLTSDIADAIGSSIGAYQHSHFYFNEYRTLNFPTVAGQSIYTVADAPLIATVMKILYAFAVVGGSPWSLPAKNIQEIEDVNLWGTITGQPMVYSWFSQSIHISPIPADVYQMRFGTVQVRAAPQADAETGNPWMVDCERLIRCRAKAELYAHVIKDPEKAATYASLAAEAMNQLRNKTDSINAPGPLVVAPSEYF